MTEAIASQEVIESLPDNSKYSPKNIPIESIIELREKGLSTSQIGKLLGCDHSNIVQRLKDIEVSKHYVKHRAGVFAYYQGKIINHITDADIQKAGLLEKIKATSFLHNAERLETGKSTQNIAYADAIKAKAVIQSEKDQLLNEKNIIELEFRVISQSPIDAGLRAGDDQKLCQP